MQIVLDKREDEIVVKVSLKSRGKRGEIKFFSDADVTDWVERHHPDLTIKKIIQSPAKPLNNADRLAGTWVFSLKKEKTVDILDNNVKMDQISIEAKSLKKEVKKEASLPYGLKKQTKTKRKRATRKKKIEE